jgi:23S rRNA (pseudouridine1915-N3)-methyltransferase
MRIWIAAVGTKPRAGFEELAQMYLERIAGYLGGASTLRGGAKAGVEAPMFRSEEALWQAVEREHAKTLPLVVLLDERGKSMRSEAFAAWLGRERDEGRQLVIFAVGPADGWEQGSELRAQSTGKRGKVQGPPTGRDCLLLSLGPMTMAHELARVAIAEQVYRALTILAGHPYHRG